jgi:hypothetical protein
MKKLLKIRPLVVGLSLFSLAWMIVLEAHPLSERLGFTVSGGVNYDQILFSALLVLASAALLSKRLWNLVAAAVFSGVVLANVLFRDFWLLARAAEVPRFSYRHFSLWWPNLSEGQLFQITLASTILAYSIASLLQLGKGTHTPNDA